SAIEQRQARDGHHQHERGGRDHPCGVGPVDLRCCVLRQCRRGGRDEAQRGGNAARHATAVSCHAVPLYAVRAYKPFWSVSPVLMRTALWSDVTRILPSSIWPVLADAMMASTTAPTRSDGTATSMRIFGRKFTAYSAPR